MQTSTILAIGAALACIQALAGFVLGWWWRSHKAVPPAPAAETERAQEALDNLRALASSMADNVGEHSNRVSEITQGLQAAPPKDGSQLDVVLATVAEIVKANGALQEQLVVAETRLSEQAQQIERHLVFAMTDALMGRPNRRSFDQEIARRFAEWQRRKTPLSLMMVDVDHFKKLNDQHGHQAGDLVLKGVADELHTTMREVDIVARYGGEEFAVIMPVTSLAQSHPAAERARLRLAEARYAFDRSQLACTVSIGIAEAVPGEDISSLIKRADSALYAAKRGGRNRTYLHDGKEILPGPLPPAALAQAQAADAARASLSDALTGLPNRTALCEEIRRRVAEAHEQESKLALLIVRVDRMQELVSKHGKGYGDLAVQTVARFLSAAGREIDFIARYEDDSLAVVSPGITSTRVLEIGERLQTAMALCPLKTPDGHSPLNVSLGSAEASAQDDSLSLLKRAERSLKGVGAAQPDIAFAASLQTLGSAQRTSAVLA